MTITRPGPYQYPAEEFERRLRTRREAGEVVDPRIAQIQRLKAKVAELKERLAQRDETVAELTTFKALAVSRLAAQHDEIVHVQEEAAALGNVRGLAAAPPSSLPCSASFLPPQATPSPEPRRRSQATSGGGRG